MKTSDSLVKLHQLACALELEDQQMSAYEVANGLMEAFNTMSVSHTLQLIREAQEIREALIAASENLDWIHYNLKPFSEAVRKANG